tara:strand:+ start:228 stop:506 length:279 start_codon:yes stop_codon:yes gene_type:complete
MNIESIASYAAGPASAVIVMLIGFYALYTFATKHLVPLAKLGLERHLSALDALVTAQREDHGRMIESLTRIEEHCSHLSNTDHGVSSTNGRA